MIGSQEEWVPGLTYVVEGAVLKPKSLQLQVCVKLCNGVEIRLEGYPAQRQDNTCLVQYLEFTRQVLGAIGYLISGRVVLRRSAANGGGQVGSPQLQLIINVFAGRYAREPMSVEGSDEQVARPVPGEHAACAVGPMCRWREPDDQQLGPGVSEPRNRLAPVSPRPELTLPLPRHPGAVSSQPGASVASNYSSAERLERVRNIGGQGFSHTL